MNSRKLIFLSVIFMVTLLACDHDEGPATTQFVAQSATDITTESAVLNGTLTLGDTEILDYGFVYSTVSNRTLEGYTTVSLGVPDASGEFSIMLEELAPGTTYYFRAYVSGDTAGLYTRELSFTTEE